MVKTANTGSRAVIHEECIDLPGEAVQCWAGGVDKLRVVLRKHRDVVFDINLGTGKTYTLTATESDFYNARDKKLVMAAHHDKVTFKDGERMHVWVSRSFRGALILKCNDHVISEVRPNEWDKHRHSDNPKEKPAPIIVAIAAPPSPEKPAAPANTASDVTHDNEAQSMHVHEVSKEGAAPAVLKFFEDGGESLYLDKDNIITRNWIIAQIVGAAGYMLDNHAWIRELHGCDFHLQRVVHKSGPKVYMVFSGNKKLREVMSASRYSLKNTKIMKITGGAGGVKQTWDTAKGVTRDSLKVFAKEEGRMVVKGGGVAVFFTIAMDVAEWHKDFSEIGPDGKPRKDLCDLFAKVGTDLVKAGLVAALTTVSVAAVFGVLSGLAVIGSIAIAVPVVAVVVGTIAISAFWAYRLEKADKAAGHVLGEADTTAWLAKKFREVAQYLSEVSKDVRYEDYSSVSI